MLPPTFALETIGNWSIQHLQGGGGKINQTDCALHSAAQTIGDVQHKRNVNEFFRDLRRWMVTATMIQELFAMIARQCEDTIVPFSLPPQRLHQPIHLLVDPANSGVVQAN